MKVERVPYSSEAHRALAAAKPPADLAHEIARGDVTLWRIDGGRAWVATEPEGDELWVHAIAGRQRRHDVIRAVLRSADRRGFAAVRCLTKRPGMVRILRRFGFYAIRAGKEWRMTRLYHHGFQQ